MGRLIDVNSEISENARKVLERRYLRKDDDGRILETPEEMFRRVAQNIATADSFYGKNVADVAATEEAFFKMMASFEFLPNSPTLMNAGRDLQQLAACFVLSIDDSMESIFNTIKDTAMIHKSGGGTGFSFSRLRPKNSPVRSTGGVSSGPVSFMKVFNAATQAVKQGGTRRGANMGILRVDHPDIVEFITCKENDKEITNFNISIALTEDFMERAVKNEPYDLIDPRTKQVVGSLNAKDVFDLIIKMAWKNGEPGIIFIDRVNKDNPTPKVGAIESTNPCVTGDTLVSTEKGLMKMRDLVGSHPNGGLRIFTDDRVQEILYGREDGGGVMTQKKVSLSLNTISAAFKTGTKPVLKLTTESGIELTATTDHKVMTTGGWVMMRNLKPGVHKVIIQPTAGTFNEDDALPFTVTNEHTGDNGVTYTRNMPHKWTRELGQVLGWLIGDGWLRDGDKNCRVGFTFSQSDKAMLDHLKPVINNFYGADIREVCRENNVYHLSYHSKYFVEFFKKLGVGSWTSEDKEVPATLFTATRDAVIGFLQALFTADGTVRDHPESNSSWIALTAKNKTLLTQVQQLLLNLGIKSRIYASDGILFELGIFGESRERFRTFVGFLDDKNVKLDNVKFKRFYRQTYEEDIVSVEKAGTEDVYDLTEPTTLTFITNGLASLDCGEQPLLPYESCNLGSINLSKMVVDGEIDWGKLRETIRTAVHFLDNVIDMNAYPLKKIEETTKANRKIGLGVMGFADMLLMLGIEYDTDVAIRTGEKVMQFVVDEARVASEALASERGAFPNFAGSVYDAPCAKPLRNATLTTIAPTGTLSIIANCSSGIEPVFAISYIRNILDNTKMIEVHPYFKEVADKRGFYSVELMNIIAQKGSVRGIAEIPADVQKTFVTAHDIDPVWHIRMQAAFQKHTHNAVSKTVNLPHDASEDDVRTIYMLAYEGGCKGVTIYRDRSRGEQVLSINHAKEEPAKMEKEKAKEKVTPPEEQAAPDRRAKIVPKPRPNVTVGTTTKIATGCGNLYVTINEDQKGMPFEVFMSMGKAGGCAMSQLEAIGRLVSLALRSGIETSAIVEQLRGIRCPSPSWEKGGRIFSCSDAIARVIERRFQDVQQQGEASAGDSATGSMTQEGPAAPHAADTAQSGGGTVKGTGTKTGNIVGVCPDCGSSLWHIEGCMVCKSCGYSKCG